MAARRALLVIALLGALPLASAGSPLEAHLRFPHGAFLAGDGRVEAEAGALDLGLDVAAGRALRVSWSAATLLETVREYTKSVVPTLNTAEAKSNDTRALGAGSIDGLRCTEARCIVLLYADAGEGGAVGLEGALHGTFSRAAEPFHAWTRHEGPLDDNFDYQLPAGAYALAHGALGPFESAKPIARGVVHLVLWNVEATLQEQGSREPLWTGTHPQGQPGPLSETFEQRFLVLRLEGARLDAPSGQAALHAQAPALSWRGALDAADASGAMTYQGSPRALDADALRVEGALELRPDAGSAAGAPTLLAKSDAGGLEGALHGDASLVRVGSRSLSSSASGPTSAAIGVGLAALLLAWGRERIFSVGLALFTRITASRVLSNENRRRLFERVGASPGATVTQLTQEAGLAEVVVRYHLRFLETHGMIHTVRDGRARRSYPAEARGRLDDHAARYAVAGRLRRRIATALADGAATQGDIAAASGVGQRQVSYHLQHLVRAGLAAREGERPARYAADPRLLRALGR